MDYGDVSGGNSDDAVRAIVAQLVGAPAQSANPSDPVAAPAIMPAPAVTPAMTAGIPGASAPAMTWGTPQPAAPNPHAALMGALVAPRAPRPTMGTVYAPAPVASNTQGLATIAQGISAGLDGRDALKQQDALQDAIQDATEGD